MSGPNLIQTRLGQDFFGHTMPELARNVERIADALEGKKPEYGRLLLNVAAIVGQPKEEMSPEDVVEQVKAYLLENGIDACRQYGREQGAR